MKNQMRSSVIILCTTVPTIIIYVFVSFKYGAIQKLPAISILTSNADKSCDRLIKRKSWLQIRTFNSSEVRACVLNITNRTSSTIYFAGNSIIRNLMTDLTEIVNSMNHVDYSVYKRHCLLDGCGSLVKNCNFTNIIHAGRNESVIMMNLEGAQYFGDVDPWFSKSDTVVLMIGHRYLMTEWQDDKWFSHFWNDFNTFLSKYKVWSRDSSHSKSRHLTYITPTYICCDKVSNTIPPQEFNAKLYNATRAAAEILYDAGASVLDLLGIMLPQNEVSPFSCSRWLTEDCVHPSALNAKFIQMYINGMCADQRPGDTFAERQHFWIGI
jgi:hypothetical protein